MRIRLINLQIHQCQKRTLRIIFWNIGIFATMILVSYELWNGILRNRFAMNIYDKIRNKVDSSHRERKFDRSNFSSQNFLMVPILLQYFWVSKAKLKWHTLCYMVEIGYVILRSNLRSPKALWQRVTIYVIFLIILTFSALFVR